MADSPLPAPTQPQAPEPMAPPTPSGAAPVAKSRLGDAQNVPAGLAQEAPGGSAPQSPGTLLQSHVPQTVSPPQSAGPVPPTTPPPAPTLAATPRVAPLGGLNNAVGAAPPPPPPPPPPASVAAKGANFQETPGLGKSNAPAGKGGLKTPSLAEVKKSPKKFILIGLAVVTVLAVLGLVISNLFGGSSSSSVSTTPTTTRNGGDTPTTTTGGTSAKGTSSATQTTLVYWGLWEPSEVLDEVIADFESQNPGVKIDYRKQSHLDYRERLQTAIASGNGPDIFRFHASWTPMLREELAALPSKVMTPDEYKKTFYPVAVRQLQLEGQLIGIPLMYDGLSLYYNKEVLKTAGVEPPTTWAELKKMANDLTVPSDRNARTSGKITRAGLAIGNAGNVEHFSDIIALLILQNGGSPDQPNTQEVSDALVFYTNFVKADKVWDDSLPSSTVAFARGDVAMMLAPSWRAHEVLAMNPDLDFGITTVPKLGDETVAWASYWAEGVNSKSKNKDLSWQFLKYLSSKEVLQKLYSSASQNRAFGEIYPRLDMAADLADDPYVGPFVQDAPDSHGWNMSSYTHDNGINDQTIKYYQDAINAILGGKQADDVLETLEKGVSQVVRQYGG